MASPQKSKVKNIFQIVVWCLVGAITVLSLCPSSLRPVTHVPHAFEHLVIFLAAGIAFGCAYPYRISCQTSIVVVFAAGIELSQLLVPGRHARLIDFFFNAFGAYIGITLALMIRRFSGSRLGKFSKAREGVAGAVQIDPVSTSELTANSGPLLAPTEAIMRQHGRRRRHGRSQFPRRSRPARRHPSTKHDRRPTPFRFCQSVASPRKAANRPESDSPLNRGRSGYPGEGVRDYRAASCPRSRGGTGRAAAIPAPPGRRSRRGRRAGRETAR